MKPIDVKYKFSKGNITSFKSKEEESRYLILAEMQNKGLITDLHRGAVFTLLQPVYKQITVRQELKTKTKIAKKMKCVKAAVTLSAEFTYHTRKGKFRVEVVKPANEYKDPTYIIKNKLMYYLHRISIIEN